MRNPNETARRRRPRFLIRTPQPLMEMGGVNSSEVPAGIA